MNPHTTQMLTESVKCFANDVISEEPKIGRRALIGKVRAKLKEKITRINDGRRNPAERISSPELWLFFIRIGIWLIIEIWKRRRGS